MEEAPINQSPYSDVQGYIAPNYPAIMIPDIPTCERCNEPILERGWHFFTPEGRQKPIHFHCLIKDMVDEQVNHRMNELIAALKKDIE